MSNVTTLDLSTIAEALDGQWVVFRERAPQPIGHGPTPLAALADAGVRAETPGILLARIPNAASPEAAE